MRNSQGNLNLSGGSFPFKNDDIFLLGSNLPHQFVHDIDFSTNNGIEEEAIALHFNERFMGKCMLQLPEMSEINAVLNTAKHGLQLIGKLKAEVKKEMLQIRLASNLEKLLIHIEILLLISKSEEYKTIGGEVLFHPENGCNEKRIVKVYKFTMDNFHSTNYYKRGSGYCLINERIVLQVF